jgi:hypothetical protein
MEGQGVKIIASFPQLSFVDSSYFAYDASEDRIYYDEKRLGTPIGQLSLLHEISHCLLGHFHYNSDLELLMMELAAWEKTRELAAKHNIATNENYISDCITTYDNWLTKRATCPNCQNFCLQNSETDFRCFACSTKWRVSTRTDTRVVRRLIPIEN